MYIELILCPYYLYYSDIFRVLVEVYVGSAIKFKTNT